jgi:hypothetical protein
MIDEAGGRVNAEGGAMPVQKDSGNCTPRNGSKITDAHLPESP